MPEIALRILKGPWRPEPIGALTLAEFVTRAAPPGEPGEIVVGGAHVLRGYYQGRGDEETKFRVDEQVWHRTGDAGYLDARWPAVAARPVPGAGRGRPRRRLSLLGRVRRHALRRACSGRRSPSTPAPACCWCSQCAGQTPDLAQVAAELAWAHLAEVREYPVIPVDRRHNAKVDYTALPRLLATAPSRSLTVSHS